MKCIGFCRSGFRKFAMVISQSIDVCPFYGASGQVGSYDLQSRVANRQILERFVARNEVIRFARNTRYFRSLDIGSNPSFEDDRKA